MRRGAAETTEKDLMGLAGFDILGALAPSLPSAADTKAALERLMLLLGVGTDGGAYARVLELERALEVRGQGARIKELARAGSSASQIVNLLINEHQASRGAGDDKLSVGDASTLLHFFGIS